MEVDSSEFFKWACTASVGQQINESRVAQQITQDELGEIAGCGGPHISKIEHGLMFPTGNTLARISAALGTPIVIGPEHGQISGGAANSKRAAGLGYRKRISKQVTKSRRNPGRPGEEYVKAGEIAKAYFMSISWARERMRNEAIPRIRVGGKNAPWWYSVTDVRKILGREHRPFY